MPIALGEAARRAASLVESPPPAEGAPAEKVPAGAEEHGLEAAVREDWSRYKSTGAIVSRNRLVAHYMKTHVRPIAARVNAGLPNQVELDDLVQQGYLGLIDAMDRFDLGREIRFETFSRRRIFGAIQDYLRSIDTVPRLTRSRSNKLRAVCEQFQKQHGRPPTDDELRQRLDLPEPILARLLIHRRPPMMVPFSGVHPDAGDAEEGESDAMDGFEARGQTGPHLLAAKHDLQRWITRGFDTRDRLIVILYYYEEMTMLEIGRTIGISESRVSQQLDTILRCLRSRLSSEGTEHELVMGRAAG